MRPRTLGAELRARTAAAHAEAQAAPLLAALATGAVSTQEYAALVGRLLPVYEALERVEERWRTDPRVGILVQPELRRAQRLRADLAHLTGSHRAAATASSVAYARRIDEVAGASAPAFVAHHCTRYLGDLSGGQVVRAALGRSLGLGDGIGASWLHFPDEGAGVLKQAYRLHLDALFFDDHEREELVAEALVAYRLNVDLAADH